ncbi:hypothetical protein VF04_04010 [Nostoc linckia z7]|nr:hypothetical protein VF02_11495 [Nostoc linckia z1]PHJ70136.1 hypothetical protein VF05_11655 [Nostoc linckia z3]PHJ82925.1 hypothetical protein VF06_14315 [Nostoc linckia z4]PHJ89022.1 hypothetical protein VF07_13510 [Nostoc linckia z6]PHK00081.1 hypothetical protein VF04_04010 [Nostoc linckia z7]PHK23253.1 hypothetical protein VF11_02785 [Nostoc linckia z14]PHK26989.1 hypothetical protein VF10_00700 [Nostoc linckia z13]PHK42881.1 hypothetical protein VF12_00710 [Nostoc linckia z15]PHK4
MQLKASYIESKLIRISLVGFSPSDPTCQTLKKMLESKKFRQLQSDQWERSEFAEARTESFEFWFRQTKELCNKFKSTEPQPIQQEPIAQDYPEIKQLLEKVRYLEEEVERLKKFDTSANKRLQQLRKKKA